MVNTNFVPDKKKKKPLQGDLNGDGVVNNDDLVLALQNIGTGSSVNNQNITVPLFDGSNRTGQITVSDAVNLPVYYSGAGASGKKSLNAMSRYLFGKPGASLTDIMIAWQNVVGYAGSTKNVTIDSLIKSKTFKPILLKGTSYEPSEPTLPTRNISLSDRASSNAALTAYSMQWLDRPPTKAEQNDFYKRLTAAQRKSPTVTTYNGRTSTTTGGGVTAEEFAKTYILSKINVKNPDLQGQLGTIQDAIKSYAAANGITVSDNYTVNLVKKIAQGADPSSYKQDLNNQAQQKYTALAQQLKDKGPDVTVMDLAHQYVMDMASTLELDPNQITIKDIEPAISTVGDNGQQRTLAAWEWRKALRNDPRYQFTGQAHQEAAAFGQAFARSMGVNI